MSFISQYSHIDYLFRKYLENPLYKYSTYSGPKFEASFKMKQEGILANWSLGTLTPKDLEEATNNLIKKATEQYDNVGKLKPEELTVENCVQVRLNL